MDWDEELPGDLKAKWNTFLNNIKSTTVVVFPQSYVITTIKDFVVEYTLHDFSDESNKAYGAKSNLV